MSLSPYALCSVAELKTLLVGGAGTDNDTRLERVINAATQLVETFLDRRLVTRGADQTEFHTVPAYGSRILTLEWPILSLSGGTEGVWEDATRGYAAATKLTLSTDYVASLPSGQLTRVESGGGLQAWTVGFRAVKVVGQFGYATTATVPADILDGFFEVAAWIWSNQDRARWGLSGFTDESGNFTRISTAHLPKHVKDQLRPHRRTRVGETGERDA